jgi:hypothetical protein
VIRRSPLEDYSLEAERKIEKLLAGGQSTYAELEQFSAE